MIFGKIVIEQKMCMLIFSAIFVWNISRCKNSARYYYNVQCLHGGFGGLEVSVLASGTQVHGFKPGFFGRKNPQHAFLRRGSKAISPM